MNVNRIELLAPAKDLECGLAAINCGADAVYLGAPQFGARAAAGNSLDDIAALVRYAHKYWARVYVTVNTLLRNAEIPLAVSLIHQLHELGIDGLIIQDTGLLECDLPPLPLIASTQMNNATPEKVAFLEQVGFQRVILARELDLGQLRAIRQAAPRIELECFIYGALCVGASGQCYMSYALGGRSGNRGQCAQPCRMPYALVDGKGRTLESGCHLLSLRDLNISDHLAELIEAGICSFKIEGRLKDAAYVANAVTHCRSRLDEALGAAGLRKGSSGASTADFTPDPAKTFNRGFTTHFLHGRGGRVGSPDTPKMVGEPLGRVTALSSQGVTIGADAATGLVAAIHPGDGLCFFDTRGELRGANVNAVEQGPRGTVVVLEKTDGLEWGMLVYRNHDHEFLTRLRKARPERRIAVTLTLREVPGGLVLQAVDEDGNQAEARVECQPEPAQKPEAALATIRRQLEKTGATEFSCAAVEIDLPRPVFLPLSSLNELRRGALEALTILREANRPKITGGVIRNEVPYPEPELSYLGNVLNQKAEAFYHRHGVRRIEPAPESGRVDLIGRKVMTTRYCLKHQLGLCPKEGSPPDLAHPLTLVGEDGARFELRFDCRNCQMEIFFGQARSSG